MLSIAPPRPRPGGHECLPDAEAESGEAAVIDPAWMGSNFGEDLKKHGWHIGQL